MKILIAYSSRTGTAKICASLLGSHLNTHSVTYADLSEASPDPTEFDAIIIGTSIRYAKAGKPFLRYIENLGNELSDKIFGFYICAANSEEDEIEYYAKKNIPEQYRSQAFCISYFGGELNKGRAKGFDKILIRLMRSSFSEISDDADTETRRALPTIAEPVIAQYADSLKKELILLAQKRQN